MLSWINRWTNKRWLTLLFIGALSACQNTGPKQGLQALTPDEFNKRLQIDTILIDVRNAEEFRVNHIERAINLPVSNDSFRALLNRYDTNAHVLFYSNSGLRSKQAAQSAIDVGFDRVYHLSGGLEAWKANRLPYFEDLSQRQKERYSNDEYNRIVASEKLVLVDFYADWCGPCKMMDPHLKKLKQQYSEDELKIVKIDVDKNRPLSTRFDIRSIPLTKVYKNGMEVENRIGYMPPEQVDSILQSHGLAEK
jgi:thioredoxin